jgi:hypothetical protein
MRFHAQTRRNAALMEWHLMNTWTDGPMNWSESLHRSFEEMQLWIRKSHPEKVDHHASTAI